MDNKELDLIISYARTQYLNGISVDEILQDINTRHNAKFTINAFNKWRVIGEWDKALKRKNEIVKKDSGLLQKLPSAEVITNNQIEGLLKNQEIIKEVIQKTKQAIDEKHEIGEAFDNQISSLAKLSNSFKDNAVAIDKLVNKTLIGTSNQDITIIVSNFIKDKERLQEAEVIDDK